MMVWTAPHPAALANCGSSMSKRVVKPGHPSSAPQRPGSRWPIIAVLAVAIAVVTGTITSNALSNRNKPAPSSSKEAKDARGTETPEVKKAEPTAVEVVHPTQGGIDRVCVQPGTVEPIAHADLYAKVSGYLADQTVDIGIKVKQGQVLAKLAVPEYEKQVQKDEAELEHVKARVQQMQAKLLTAEAEARTSKSSIVLNEALAASKTSYRAFRKKQLERMKDLLTQNAVDARTVDEAEDLYESAFSAEIAAKEGVTTAKLTAEASEAKVAQVKADLNEANAQVRVADAELARAKVLLSYSEITSPYDGTITRRNFFPGDFIRAADGGSDRKPLFTVEKTDRMRIIIQIPDRDAPFLNVGDPAKVWIDALGDKKFEAVVARIATAEDPATRSVHTEVDVPNPDGLLWRGMYGKASVLLEPGAPKALTVPSSALEGKAGDGHATVRIVRDGKAQIVPVRVGTDNGIHTEVLDGLKIEDAVIVRASGPLEDGAQVEVNTK
jgi:HlyD family secretion protein